MYQYEHKGKYGILRTQARETARDISSWMIIDPNKGMNAIICVSLYSIYMRDLCS